MKTKIPGYTGTFALTAGQVGQIQQWCDMLIGSIQLVAQKKAEVASVVATKDAQAATSINGLRGVIAQWKANPAMTPTIAADLQVTGSGSEFNPETYQTEIKAEAFAGYVRIKFKKGKADGINLYSRLKGQATWKFVARDTNSPYDDHTPLAVAGTAEVREYQAFGVLDDVQIGVGSAIVEVSFAG